MTDTLRVQADRLRDRARRLDLLELEKALSLPVDLANLPLTADEFLERCRELRSDLKKSGHAVYVFKIDPRDAPRVREAYASVLKNDNDRYPPIKKLDSEILYVGKITKNPWKRLHEHCSQGRKKFSSLRLGAWMKDLAVTIDVYLVSDKDLLEDIEEALARELKPMFGRHRF